jgi:endonuclease/exonuclease/phosphatase family metal-dependent hydrolase
MKFRVLTFNIQNGQPWNDVNPDEDIVNLDAIARFLLDQQADILLLQEVERGHDGGYQENPPPNYEKLKSLLPGYDSVFAYPIQNSTEIPFGLGLAIFSQTPLTDFKKIDLAAAPIQFEFGGKTRQASHRLLIEADTIIKTHKISLTNTHLQSFFMIGSSSKDHPEQRNQVLQCLQQRNGPTILGGDMNSAPGEGLVEQFSEAGYQTAQNHDVTWHRREYITDHIFFSHHLRLIHHSVVRTNVSDHFAVVADLEIL